MKYCTKGDNYISNFDVDAGLGDKLTRRKMGKMLIDGTHNP